MGRMQREKGKRGERDWVLFVKDHGWQAKRTQQRRGDVDAFDVEVDDFPVKRWEVKNAERLNVRQVLQQALDESEGEKVGVAWKKNNERWIVVMDAEQFFEVMRDA